jgi:hypothetical protein
LDRFSHYQCYKEGIILPSVASFTQYSSLQPTLEQEDPWTDPDCISESWATDDLVDSEGGGGASTFPTMTIPAGKWTVGKLSVLMLLFVTLTDFALSHITRLEAPEMYDALSADVIRPPFVYQSVGISSTNVRPRLGLGSAAISTVTETLSPILPFTGGVDLRREDYWIKKGTWFETLQSVAGQAMDAFASEESTEEESSVDSIPRGGGNMPDKLAGQLSSRKKSKTNHVSSISAQHPFVDIGAIQALTLGDVAETFRYALESSSQGFNEARFLNGQLPRVRKVLTAMQDAVGKSRGKDAMDALVASSNENGDIDALKFSAAMRIFAEWRVVRQVPEGYKGYAVGMGLGHKDIVQNVAKIEQTVHSWLDHRREFISVQAQWEKEAPGESCPVDRSQAELRSPTLRELLQHELEMEVHPTLPRLKDKTAAMGLLWVRRQLHYQTETFENILDIPLRFASTQDAVLAAYREVYDKYHGWAVQKIFSYSFQAAPQDVEVFKFMNPHRMREVLKEAEQMKSTAAHLNQNSSADIIAAAPMIDMDDTTNQNPFMGFVKHVGGEWDKLVGSVLGSGAPHTSLSTRWGSGSFGLQGKELDDVIKEEMVKDAHHHIAAYLDVVDPLLENLAGLFETFNMDDPTKV